MYVLHLTLQGRRINGKSLALRYLEIRYTKSCRAYITNGRILYGILQVWAVLNISLSRCAATLLETSSDHVTSTEANTARPPNKKDRFQPYKQGSKYQNTMYVLKTIGTIPNPMALRTHVLRLLGPKTRLYRAFGLFGALG